MEDVFERCHKRYAEKDILRQRKTVITPALYKSFPYHIKVHCVRSNPMTLDALENAEISFMPIGHAPENDQGPRDLGGDRFLKRQTAQNWRLKQWHASWGIQIYTGVPSERDDAQWHDFEFTYQAICAAPEAVATCIEALLNMTATPLLTVTKSGGLRFSCRIQNYLHPNTDEAKFFIYKQTPTSHRDTYLKIHGDKGYSRWDMRYEILFGNLLEPPVITKEVLFAPINNLRAALHEPESSQEKLLKDVPKTENVILSSLGSANLDLAKKAFLKRGFTYDQEANGFHYWTHKDVDVSLWEDKNVVWVRAATPNTELPTRAVPITDIWNDTGISAPTLDAGLPVNEKVNAIRDGNLSPLAIKRSPQKLHKQQTTPKVYKTLKERSAQLQDILKRETRILAITTSEVGILTNTETETDFLHDRPICLNIPSRRSAEAIEERYRSKKLTSVARWRSIMYRWDQVKDISIDIRMANPFQHGNVCEDPERFRAVQEKGGNPREIICSQCPVYTACQERGYLSQPLTLQRANAQITPVGKLFLDPRHTHLVQHTLGSTNELERICIIDERKTGIENLFFECLIPKKVIEEWSVNWQGNALGNFAAALMNALETQREPYNNPIGLVRAVVEAFQQHADEIIQQMCYINIQGKIVAHRIADTKTKTELARYAIDNTETVEKINSFPTVCPNPDWTYWHQLRRFFAHYPRNADAPMRLNDEFLTFWMPPKLHPNVKRLVLISTFLSNPQLRRAFPDEEMDVIRIEPTAWVSGNKVFQLRTSNNSLRPYLNYNNNSRFGELSKLGECYFSGIHAEINRDPSIKHAIVTNGSIKNKLADLAAMQNVCFVANFKALPKIEKNIKTAQVLWIVGTPYWHQHAIWHHAQMLFGNDKKPLNYEADVWTDNYKDERIQEVYDQNVVGILTQIVGWAGLNSSSGKTVMLLNNLEIPNITDRPETSLFDWEDFEIAGGLHKLEETIRTRERFETERENLTAEASREEVERILGCSSRQANRMLQKLRGGNIPRVTLREQILFLLSSSREKTTSSFVSAIDASPQAIGNELKRLLDEGKIIRVRRGVYALP
ncbi:MAG: helix-turn-helix transcriptional regulator [Candidatus Poribacteria bacterium]|nr:helix-turn-helix transcriptional regulator [Candidatus Poribacteria bacterium]